MTALTGEEARAAHGNSGSAYQIRRHAQGNESTIRRRARDAGFRVRKSRKVNITPEDQGEYMLIDASTGFPACGYRYDADLQEIDAFLVTAHVL